jgi:hypothetical protein
VTDFLDQRNVARLQANRPEYYKYAKGLTGKLDANGTLVANASEGLPAGETWVRLDGSREAVSAINLVMNPYAADFDVEVAMNRRRGRFEILNIHPDAFNRFPPDVVLKAATPAPPTVKPVDMEAGRAEPSSERGGLWIFVRSFQFPDGSTFPVAAEDAYYNLSTLVGTITTDMTAPFLITVDTADKLIHVEVGDERSLAYPYQPADFDAIPLPDGVVPLAGYVMRAGQTQAIESYVPYKRYFDQRIILSATGTTSGGASAFTDLTDVPASYSGEAGKYAKVNATEDGLEFDTPSGSSGSISAGVYASLPAAGSAGRAYHATDVPYLLIDNGSSWDAFWNNIPVTPPPSSGWSWDNQGGASIDSLHYLTFPAASGANLRVRYRTAPSTPYVIDALIVPNFIGAANVQFGAGFRQSSDGKLAVISVSYDGSGTISLGSQKFNSPTSFSANYVSVNSNMPQRVWLRFADDGTNRIVSVFDGFHAVTFHSVGRTDFLTADQLCWFVNANNATYGGGAQLLSWRVS